MTVPVRIVDTHMCRPVKGSIPRVLHVGLKSSPTIEEEVVLGSVRRKTKVESFFANGRRKLADDVPVRPHLRRAPIRQFRVVHRETVMMLSNRNYVSGTGLTEDFGPDVRVKFLCPKLRDKIFVPECALRSVGFDMML